MALKICCPKEAFSGITISRRDDGSSYSCIKIRKMITLNANDVVKVRCRQADATPDIQLDHPYPGALIITKFNPDNLS